MVEAGRAVTYIVIERIHIYVCIYVSALTKKYAHSLRKRLDRSRICATMRTLAKTNTHPNGPQNNLPTEQKKGLTGFRTVLVYGQLNALSGRNFGRSCGFWDLAYIQNKLPTEQKKRLDTSKICVIVWTIKFALEVRNLPLGKQAARPQQQGVPNG